MTNQQISIVLVGMGGYGQIYLERIFSGHYENVYVTGLVDIAPERSRFYQEVMNQEIPIYHTLEDFYQEQTADLAIIASPIHLHKSQACLAMEQGSHVLCEKPATGNPQQLQEMIQTRDRTGKKLAIGFNWSFTNTIQQLKHDILKGTFGRAISMKSLVLWPRNADYFNRSSWAGKQYSSDGDWIFDSVANNATAHFLHHLFYLAGDTMETSASIKELTCELYRANPIETFDTCAVEIQTTNHVNILYLASHAVANEHRPRYKLVFEKAVIHYEPVEEDDQIVVQWKDGTETTYEDPEKDHLAKLDVMLSAMKNDDDSILCGPEAASTHVEAIYAMHQSVPNVPSFPDHLIHYHPSNKLTTVDGLEGLWKNCYLQFCLPHELDVPWSSAGKTITF
ncbi:Gfo/Idh/MocA family protein [Gracilibacillus timonensis]|uniref:Gfo/Idh/MocA family protein n=1 Tax=Gracilibacillus timonensis TaxID=1816696 RepID=UPI0008263CF0|nr:Gfo/Idh/MocA family oxidoreductase [Gracilibacillus timonensis]